MFSTLYSSLESRKCARLEPEKASFYHLMKNFNRKSQNSMDKLNKLRNHYQSPKVLANQEFL